MDANKLQYFKKKLLDEKNNIINTINRMNENEPNDSLQEYTNELSVYDNHPADLGTETFMMEQNMNLKDVEKLRLREIEDSLSKIEEGIYGKCDICGKEIKEERLEIIPEAKICMECANDKIPIDDLMGYRPKEEENLKFPFGRTYKDLSMEETEFDGEDSYQSVARFNEVPGDPSFTTGDNQGVFDDKDPGVVEDVEEISQDYYKGQLQGMNRDDIPDEQKKKS
ncbi:TraR/DksA C4-type zinc finger protein [Caldisalinibacter kiritimatiensis]|uniref:DnaK suppressor protein n=1 Tax=Caldisalinibacter kiritimatiensis TaxID=1304284 RepID=R1CXE1_9FIRM|nr:TraR/DksA C4-type zinc finger protein [Caldisalinibacter kiritimatiensis]EOD01294.1 DnaK suppressor protein [Caldisalinibacter kiritimatiensis]